MRCRTLAPSSTLPPFDTQPLTLTPAYHAGHCRSTADDLCSILSSCKPHTVNPASRRLFGCSSNAAANLRSQHDQEPMLTRSFLHCRCSGSSCCWRLFPASSCCACSRRRQCSAWRHAATGRSSGAPSGEADTLASFTPCTLCRDGFEATCRASLCWMYGVVSGQNRQPRPTVHTRSQVQMRSA